jgi:AcrR family transcriptional regulator
MVRYAGSMATTSQVPKRQDAQRNRAAILEVARELFAESADFPMSEVARRAEVGKATLYRNFADRSDLAAAVFVDEIDQFELLAAEHTEDPGVFFVLLRDVVKRMARSYALAELARQDASVGPARAAAKQRFAELMKHALHDAKTAGLLRPDLTIDDVLLITSMVRGALQGLDDPAARATAATRALALALEGAAPSHRLRPPLEETSAP